MLKDLPLYARINSLKPLSQDRLDSLKEALMSFGVAGDKIEVTKYEDENRFTNVSQKSSDSVMVVIDQYRVTLPKFPAWGEITPNSGRSGDVPMRCSIAYNFDKMIADPKDLYKGKTSVSVDATYQALAIERNAIGLIKSKC